MNITLGAHIDLLVKAGVSFDQMEAVLKAKKSQYHPQDDAVDCHPTCTNGFICDTGSGTCVPDVGSDH